MNPEKSTNEYGEKLRGIQLSSEARARIKASLQDYVRFHPVRIPEESRYSLRVPFGTSSVTRFNTKPMTALFVALALVFTGGVSYAAEGSVPGDFLYPVKVGINEEVRSAIAVSAESEAEVSAHLAAERLEEAEKLSARGELSAETAADLSARFSQHYKNAVNNVSTVRAEGDVETAGEIRASLLHTVDTHAVILKALKASLDGNDAQGTLDAVMQINADLDSNWVTTPASDRDETSESDRPEAQEDTPAHSGTIDADVEVEVGAPGVSGSGSSGVNISY